MWVALVLYLWRGGDRMSIQPTDIPPPVTIADPRTKADVERDMTRVARQLIEHRSRQGDTVNRLEIRDGLPALPTRELAWLQDEWATFTP